MRTLLVAIVGLVVALPGVAWGQVEVTVDPVDNSAGNQFDAAISGGYVSYTNASTGSNDVQLVIPAGTTLVVAGGVGNQQSSNVSGSLVVYTDNALGGDDIFLFDEATGNTDPVAITPNGEIQPTIAGANILYVSAAGTTNSLVWYDITGGFHTSVDPVGTFPQDPDLDGNLAAWVASDGASGNVYAAVLGAPSFVVAGGPSDETDPSVSGNLIGYIVTGDVKLYDNSTGQTTPITADAFTQSNVQVSGNFVYFNDDRDGNLDVFVYDLSTGQTHQLTTTTWSEILTDADGNQAVFHHNAGGDFNVYRLTFTLPNSIPSISFGGLALLAGLVLSTGVLARRCWEER